ncbi:MAG: hypothetical protein M0P59_02560 [Gallionella sp.]|nr:hypothetical protein [Gallionella sp.]MCK9353023.1 hypothetical protein [Gallionella sp.]
MNRDHYLSKRSRLPSQAPVEQQVVPEGKADTAAQRIQPVEPDESRPTDAGDTARQEARPGQ